MSPAIAGGFFTTGTTWQARAINRSLLVIYFIYSSVYMSVPISQFIPPHLYPWASLVSSAGKESAFRAGDPILLPRSGRPPGEGIYYPLRYSWASLVA